MHQGEATQNIQGHNKYMMSTNYILLSVVVQSLSVTATNQTAVNKEDKAKQTVPERIWTFQLIADCLGCSGFMAASRL